jgi:hypothetical protein
MIAGGLDHRLTQLPRMNRKTMPAEWAVTGFSNN